VRNVIGILIGIALTIASKNKIPRINLMKETKHLFNKSYKSLKREIVEDTRR
jgi:hypothetical protein